MQITYIWQRKKTYAPSALNSLIALVVTGQLILILTAWLRTLMRYTLSTHNNTTAVVSVNKDTRINHKKNYIWYSAQKTGEKIDFHSH